MPKLVFLIHNDKKMENWQDLFQKENVKQFQEPLIKTIGEEWLLLTAGTDGNSNTMTASWGGLGVFWNRPMAICFIRPTRHSFAFANESKIITYSFFTENERDILRYCGSHSGKDVDKIKELGLKPIGLDNKGVTYEQARLCIETKTMYFDDLKPENFPEGIDANFYPKKDYHRIYIGEILDIYTKQ